MSDGRQLEHPWGVANVNSNGTLTLRFQSRPAVADGLVSTELQTDHIGEIRSLRVALSMAISEMREAQSPDSDVSHQTCPECGAPYHPGQSGLFFPDEQPAHELKVDASHWQRVCVSTQSADPKGYMYIHTERCKND